MSQTIDQFNATLGRYASFMRRTPEEVVAHRGVELRFTLRNELKKLRPAKGSVREERKAAMAGGAGIKVRPGAIEFAKKKTLATASNLSTRKEGLFMEKTKAGNVKRGGRSFWEIAVTAELNIREKGAGYLSIAPSMRANKEGLASGRTFRATDRITREVGRVGMSKNEGGASLTFDFANPNIAEGLSRPKGKAAIDQSLAIENADMLLYVNRKLAENARKAGLS